MNGDDRNAGTLSDPYLFVSDVGKFRMAVHYTREKPGKTEVLAIEQWCTMGFDQNSIFADPMFQDAEHGDYKLKQESPAFNVGIQGVPS